MTSAKNNHRQCTLSEKALGAVNTTTLSLLQLVTSQLSYLDFELMRERLLLDQLGVCVLELSLALLQL